MAAVRIKLTYDQWQALDYLRTSKGWGGVTIEQRQDRAGRTFTHAHTAHQNFYLPTRGEARRTP